MTDDTQAGQNSEPNLPSNNPTPSLFLKNLLASLLFSAVAVTIPLLALLIHINRPNHWVFVTGSFMEVILLGVMSTGVLAPSNWKRPHLAEKIFLTFFVVCQLLTFAATYSMLSRYYAGSFSSPLDAQNAIYFSVVTASTTGFGDIQPLSHLARWFVVVQILVSVLTVVVFLGVAVTHAFSRDPKWMTQLRKDPPSKS